MSRPRAGRDLCCAGASSILMPAVRGIRLSVRVAAKPVQHHLAAALRSIRHFLQESKKGRTRASRTLRMPIRMRGADAFTPSCAALPCTHSLTARRGSGVLERKPLYKHCSREPLNPGKKDSTGKSAGFGVRQSPRFYFGFFWLRAVCDGTSVTTEL